MSKYNFENGGIYHIYNHGVENRDIIDDKYDSNRFVQSLRAFNSVEPIGSLYEISFHQESLGGPTAKCSPLVHIISYCINPNHYHLILKQVTDGGVSEFMKRLNGGYTWYFNHKNQRKGSLFQGKYQLKPVNSLEYLLRLSVYVNYNDRVHRLGGPTAKLVRSSFKEYYGESINGGICHKDIILDTFSGDRNEYKCFSERQLVGILERKDLEKEF